MFNLNFKLLWIYIKNRQAKFSTIIYSAKIMKRFIGWKCLALILSEEISDEYKKRLSQNGIVTFSTLK